MMDAATATKLALHDIENQSWRMHAIATQGLEPDQDDFDQLVDAVHHINLAIDLLRKARRQ